MYSQHRKKITVSDVIGRQNCIKKKTKKIVTQMRGKHVHFKAWHSLDSFRREFITNFGWMNERVNLLEIQRVELVSIDASWKIVSKEFKVFFVWKFLMCQRLTVELLKADRFKFFFTTRCACATENLYVSDLKCFLIIQRH